MCCDEELLSDLQSPVCVRMGLEDIHDMVARMRGNMQSFRQNFDGWASREVSHLEGLKQAQDGAIAAGEQTVCSLMQKSQALEQEVSRVKSRYAVEQHDIDVMAEALEELKAKHDSLPPQVEEAQRVHDEERRALDEAIAGAPLREAGRGGGGSNARGGAQRAHCRQ